MAETEKQKTKQVIRNNKKYFVSFGLLILGGLLSWGTWVTTGVFAGKAEMTAVVKSIEKINKDTNELQEGQKKLNEKIEENKDFIYKNNEKVIEKLMEIQKDIKKGK